MNNLPWYATQHFVLRTVNDDDIDDECSTKFGSQKELDQFIEWMDYVHKTMVESELDEFVLLKLGINIWNHKDLYRLYKNREGIPKFFEKIANYPSKIYYNDGLEDSNILEIMKLGVELD